MIILKIFLILLGIFIFLLLAILVPKTWLTVRFHLAEKSRTGTFKIQLAGKLIGGLVTVDWPGVNVRAGIGRFYFTVWQKKLSEKARPKKPPKPKPPKKPKTKPAKHSTCDWIRFGKTLGVRFFKIPQIKKFCADLVIGLGNPIGTGLMMGAYFVIRKMLDVFRSVRIVPDFLNKKITGEIEFCGSIRLIKTIPLLIFTLRFLWKK